MRRLFSSLTLTLLLTTLSACSVVPTATPKDAQVVLGKAASYRIGKKSLGNTKATRLPIKRGQWAATLIRSKTDQNDVTLQITKIVDVLGSTVIIETEQYSSTDEAKRMVTQHTIRNYPLTSKVVLPDATELSEMQIQSVKILGDDEVVRVRPLADRFHFPSMGQ